MHSSAKCTTKFENMYTTQPENAYGSYFVGRVFSLEKGFCRSESPCTLRAYMNLEVKMTTSREGVQCRK